MPPTISTAGVADGKAVVRTVVEAFRADPAFTWFFPRDYDTQASAFARLLFDTRADGNTVWMADGGAAVAMWDRPRPVDADREDDVEGALADAVDAEAVRRIVRYEEAVDSLLPREPHWYLGILATHPEQAGRRLGRTVMRTGLEQAAVDGVPAALETTNAGNVERYRGAGWSVIDEVDVDDDLHVWIMTHPGIPPSP